MEAGYWKDRLVVCDFETVEIQPDGTKQASTEFYRANFRVDSAAISWRADGSIQSKFVVGEDAVRSLLEEIQDARLAAHNLAFELGCSRCRFPEIKLNWVADTMRMVQVWDNGGDENSFEMIRLEPTDPDEEEDAKKMPLSGFGLVKSIKRIMDLPDHKIEAYAWLRQNGVKKGQEGANLNKLPADIMERYNVGDTENTLRLYEYLETKFLEIDFNWQFDHGLYMSTVDQIVNSKIRGVRVDREKLATYVEKVRVEIDQISETFKSRFQSEIRQVERMRLLACIRTKKTLRGRKKFLKRVRSDRKAWDKHIAFNTGSNKQLEQMFVDVLKIEPKFFTAKGSPAFRSALLGQWGDGGELLSKRRKRLIVMKQAQALLELSEVTGRWHVDLKAVATSTGRAAGGSH